MDEEEDPKAWLGGMKTNTIYTSWSDKLYPTFNKEVQSTVLCILNQNI